MKCLYTMIVTFVLMVNPFIISAESSVRINEAMPSNGISTYDEEGDTPDWLELYNPTTMPISLKDWRISDNSVYQQAWKFPDTTIASKSFIRVYCSEKNRVGNGYYIVEASGVSFYQSSFEEWFHFEYVKMSGDFEMSLDCISLRDIWRLSAGVALMIREDLNKSSKYAGIFYQRKPNYQVNYRDTINTALKQFVFKNPIYQKYAYMKMKRSGDSVRFAYTDRGGYEYDSYTIYFPSDKDLYAGIAMSTSYGYDLGEFILDTFKLNGEPYDIGQLTSYDVIEYMPSRKYISMELHTNFALNKDGEKIYLWNSNAELVDTLAVPMLLPDVSYGAYPDGTNSRAYFDKPSAGKLNAEPKLGILSSPKFSMEAGLYTDSFTVSLSSDDPKAKIVFSTNGAELRDSSASYNTPINISKTTSVRTRAFRDGYIPSPTVSHTYFINDTASLPSVSIATDSVNLWGENGGIFRYVHSDNRVPVNFEFFSIEKNCEYSGFGEIELIGHGASRGKHGHSSLRLNAKEKYGMKELKYDFWGSNSLSEYKSVVFRNASGDWEQAFMRDAFGCMLARRIRTLDAALSQPYYVYVNGEFYALANLREHTNEHYFKVKYNLSEESINIIKNNAELTEGSGASYFNLIDSLKNITECDTEEFKKLINTNIDVDNIIDYVILETYTSNYDWIGHNLKLWQSDEYDTKWRFVVYDLDWTCNLDWAGRPKNLSFNRFLDSTYNPNLRFPYLFGKIISNKEFLNKYQLRSQELLNTTLSPKPVRQLLDSMAYFVSLGIDRQRAKYPECAKDWAGSVNRMREFAALRSRYLLEDYVERFNMLGLTVVNINSNLQDNITVKINNSVMTDTTITGHYFKDFEQRIEILPRKGQKFLRWSPDSLGDNPVLVLRLDTLQDTFNISAIFEREEVEPDPIITEIMYKSANNSPDWIEIYNPSRKDIDISQWQIKDNDDTHVFVFPTNTMLKAKSFVVVSEDTVAFKIVYSEPVNLSGNLTFGYGKEDMVRLYNNSGVLIDSVAYSSAVPWYAVCYGSGPSLEIKDLQADNALPGNWSPCIISGGTPGYFSATTGVEYSVNNTLNAYPNPNKGTFNLLIRSNNAEEVTVELLNYLGATIESRTVYLNEGDNILNYNISDMHSTAAYYIRINSANGKANSAVSIPIIVE